MGERALVVIPTYNEAGNLPSLVPQVLAQDPRLEILVVDDQSPDGTGQIADALAAQEPRVQVLHREGKVTVVNWPMGRLLLSYCANIYARWITGLRIWDLTGGFKCFRRRVLEAIDLSGVRSNGYAFQIEMSVRAWRKGFTLREIPIVFVDRAEGQSKMNQGIVREAVWMVPRLRLMAWFGRI